MHKTGQRSYRVDSAATGGTATLDAADSRPVSEDSERRACVTSAAIAQWSSHTNSHRWLGVLLTCHRCCNIVGLTRAHFALGEQITLNGREPRETLTGRASLKPPETHFQRRASLSDVQKREDDREASAVTTAVAR